MMKVSSKVRYGMLITTFVISLTAADAQEPVNDQSLSLISLVPEDSTTEVSVDSPLMATFSNKVKAGRGYIFLHRSTDQSLVERFDVTNSRKVGFSGQHVILKPTSNLKPVTGYYLTIEASAIKDQQGNVFAGIDSKTEWNFITGNSSSIIPVNTGSKNVAEQIDDSSAIYDFDAGRDAEMLLVAISTERSKEKLYEVSYNGMKLNQVAGTIHAGIWCLDLRDSGYRGGPANLVVDFKGISKVNGLGIGVVSVRANGRDIELETFATSDDMDMIQLPTTRRETFNLVSFNANNVGRPKVKPPLIKIYADGDIKSMQGAAGYEANAMAGDHKYSWETKDSRTIVAAAFAVSNTYENWASEYELGSLSGKTDDPDGDGVPNAVEAWLGTHPKEASEGLRLLFSDGENMKVSHPISRNPPNNQQLGYMWSINFTDWYHCDGADGPSTGETVKALTITEGQTATVSLTASKTLPSLYLKAVVLESL